jgi:hypothetical protein
MASDRDTSVESLQAQRIAALRLVRQILDLHGQVMVEAVYGAMTQMGGE